MPLTADQLEILKLIRRRIQDGHELPSFCYRLNRDSSADQLLERDGIMHLHLSKTDRNATLFLIQYENDVVFLGINDHATFRDDPPGSSLYELHRNEIAKIEVAIDADQARSTARLKAAVMVGLNRTPKAAPSDPDEQ